MQEQVKVKSLKKSAKNMLRMFIGATSILLAVSCTDLPSRDVPTALGVKQVPGQSEGHPSEYVFCGLDGGAWACDEVTEKTPFFDHSGSPEKRIGVSGEFSNHNSNSGNGIDYGTPDLTLFYEFDEFEITTSSGGILLDFVTTLLGKNVEIRGYTDAIGTKSYNDDLGFLRATKVKEFLVATGLRSNDIQVFGHSLCCSSRDESGEINRSKDRKVDIYIVE